MSVKDILKNISVLLIFLIMGILSGIASTFYLFDIMPLMEQTAAPENPVAVIILPFLSAVFSVLVTIVSAVILFGLRKKVRFSLLIFHRNESKVCIVFRTIGYLIIAKLIYDGIHDCFQYKQFFITGLYSYTSDIILDLLGIIILMSLTNKDA